MFWRGERDGPSGVEIERGQLLGHLARGQVRVAGENQLLARAGVYSHVLIAAGVLRRIGNLLEDVSTEVQRPYGQIADPGAVLVSISQHVHLVGSGDRRRLSY